MIWRYKRESPEHLDGPGLQTLVALDASGPLRGLVCKLSPRGCLNIGEISEKSISLQPGSATGAGCYVKHGESVARHWPSRQMR